MNEYEESLANYAEKVGKIMPDHPSNLHLRLSREAKFYTPQVLPKQYKIMKMKECFKNAYMFAMKYSNLTYCEGLAYGVIPIHHAWTIDEDGKVVEPTWRTRKGSKWAHNTNEMAYFGITFTRKELNASIIKYELHTSMLTGPFL